MAGFFIPDPRFEMPQLFEPGRKPVGNVEIDWNHPMTRKLEAYLYAIPGGVIDLVSGRLMTKVNSPSTGIYNPHSGIATTTNGTDSYYLLEFGYSRTLALSDGIALAASWRSNVSQSDKRIAAFSNNSQWFAFESELAGAQGYTRTSSGDITVTDQNSANSAGNNYGIYMTDNDGRYGSSAKTSFHCNGPFRSSSTTITTQTLTFDQCTIGALYRTSPISFFNGQVPAVALWSRELTTFEVNEYKNTKGASIYQMLIPK
jgi:hypothetical protein